MPIKWGYLFKLWILMEITLRAVVSGQWAVWYSSKQLCVFKRSSVTFNCTYDYPAGSTVKTLLWFKSGPGSTQNVIVYHTNSEEVHTSYRGRTELNRKLTKNCTLSLLNVSNSDVGTYRFRFIMFNSNAWTGPVGTQLNVAALPFRVTVNSSRTDSIVQEGDMVNMTCQAENCTPPGLHISWYKNGFPLSQVTSKTLSFDSISSSDFGNYSCGLTYSNSSTSPDILLNVRYGPKNVSLAVHPTHTIQAGNSLTLICHGYANPKVENYTMFKMNGTDVLLIGRGRNHTITAVSSTDSGHYFCLAENAVGSQNSTVVSVLVEDAEHLPFLPAVLGAVLLGVIVAAVLVYIIKRKKKSSSYNETTKKLPEAEYTPGLESRGSRSVPDLQMCAAADSEGCYENLAVQFTSEPGENQLTYAELQFPSASSDRASMTIQEDAVIYSTVRTHREHKRATREPE